MTPEGEIQKAILEWLQAERITAWRINTGAVKVDARFIVFAVPGFSDILAIPTVSGKFKGFPCQWTAPLFIEVKTPQGRQSAEQKSFERQVKDAGGEYLLARSVEDVEAWCKQHGVRKA